MVAKRKAKGPGEVAVERARGGYVARVTCGETDRECFSIVEAPGTSMLAALTALEDKLLKEKWYKLDGKWFCKNC